MGIRGELFSTKTVLDNRTYFFNVKENRMGDIFLNIVESKAGEGQDYDRHQIVLFADDMKEFLTGLDESLKFVEKEMSAKRKKIREIRKAKQEEEENSDAPKKRILRTTRSADDTGTETRTSAPVTGEGRSPRSYGEGRAAGERTGRGGKPTFPRSKSRDDSSSGERRSFGDKKAYGDKESTGDRFGTDRAYGERASASSEGGERKSYGDRASSGDRKPYGDRASSGDRKPYGDRAPSGDRKPYGDRAPSGDRKPYGDRASSGDRKPYVDRAPSGDRKPYGDRAPSGDRKPYGDRAPSGDRKPFGSRPSAGGRTSSGDRKPFDPKAKRSSFSKSRDDSAPRKPRAVRVVKRTEED